MPPAKTPQQTRARKAAGAKMRILSLTEGAIRTVLYLALAGPERKVPGEEICRTQDISVPFLNKITRSLAGRRLVATVRGAGGGFQLAKPPEAITLLEVIEAVQGPFLYNECLVGPHTCPRESDCPVHPVWKQIRESTEKILSSWTLADLAWVWRMRRDHRENDSRPGGET